MRNYAIVFLLSLLMLLSNTVYAGIYGTDVYGTGTYSTGTPNAGIYGTDVYGVGCYGVDESPPPPTLLRIVGNDNEINICFFNGQSTSTQAIEIVTSATGNKIQNCTIVNCDDNGLIAWESATVTNTIFWGNGGDININSGATITGTYNCVEDAAKTGDGTYSDVDSTTKWNTDALMVDPANGDVTLQAQSPCIDGGTYISGNDVVFREGGGTMPNAGADGIADIGVYPFPKWGGGF